MSISSQSSRVFKHLSAWLVLCGVLALAGCGHVPLRSVPALSAIDFRTTQFEELRAAIELPETLMPRQASVRLNVKLTIEDAVAEERSYVLVTFPSQNYPELTPDAGRHIFVYGLSEQDQLGMNAIRRAIFAAQQAGQTGSLAINVEADDLCTTDALPDDGLLVDIFLKSSETGRFIRTLDGYDLRELQSADTNIAAELQPCV